MITFTPVITKTVNRIPELIARFPEVVRNELIESISRVEAQAKILAPVDTGNLRNSIQTEVTGPFSVACYTDVEYAPYQEFGSRWIAPVAFMQRSAEHEFPQLLDHLQNLEFSLGRR